ncbi:MAG: Na+/H+ antiporter NhaA [Isosphaeraceae bacterium]
MANDERTATGGLPRAPVEQWLTPVRRFLHIESASGVVLLACTVVALILANSPLAGWFAAIWKTKIELNIGGFQLAGDLGHLVINDGLMAIFFFVIGLEIKREIVAGELGEIRRASLPIFAAIGGMVVPACVYLALQWGQPGQRGWAIPMATDIAFVVGFLTLFGSRVPFSLKILLLSLAIVDDLGAVLVIAFVYTGSLAWNWLAVAAVGFGLTYGLNRAGVRSVGVYVVVGALIWVAVHRSGMHPTVAGVLLGLLTPASAWVGDKTFLTVVGDLWGRLRGYDPKNGQRYADLHQLQFVAREAVSPLHRLETALHPWVGFVIMPVFALANAGMPLEPSGVSDPVAVAIAAGLVVGKPVGIVLFCWLAVRLGPAALPDGVSWPMLVGGACLAGIGFTMALFINGLAFPVADFPAKEAAGKIGVLLGSLVSAVLGAGILLWALRGPLGANRGANSL